VEGKILIPRTKILGTEGEMNRFQRWDFPSWLPLNFVFPMASQKRGEIIKNASCPLYSLTLSWSWALLEKLPIVQLLKNFPAFYGTRRLITVFTRALHWSLSWARSIQSIPSHSVSLRSILTLSTDLRLGLPSGLFPSGYPTCIPLRPNSCYMPCPSHPPWLDHSNYTWRRVQSYSY
jgi:hypothetical protein